MFKFGFKNNDETAETEHDEPVQSLQWFPACEIEISAELLDTYGYNEFEECNVLHGIELNLINCDAVIRDLKRSNCTNIIEAESQSSDVIPAKYEGGLKIWGCSYSLGNYLLDAKVPMDAKLILDLGCGAGLVGILALLKGARGVHFQDYNTEVINSVTIPNVLRNVNDQKTVKDQCRFFSGDWASFTELREKHDETSQYDLILTSATIYNADNYYKLYDLFLKKLKKDGSVYVAGQIYYFGVGGGMRQFENVIRKNDKFQTETVWKSNEQGVQEEILKITFKDKS